MANSRDKPSVINAPSKDFVIWSTSCVYWLAVLLRCCRLISFADNTSTVSPLTLLFNLEMTSVIVVSFPIRFLATPFSFVFIMETANCSCSPFIDSVISNASIKLVKFSA